MRSVVGFTINDRDVDGCGGNEHVSVERLEFHGRVVDGTEGYSTGSRS